MPSPAAVRYQTLAANAKMMMDIDRNAVDRQERQILFGAIFVAQVAAWNAYVASIIDCFFDAVSDPFDKNFSAMFALSSQAAKAQLSRFSTPNSENARTLIFNCTGYDPWMDWQWSAKGMSALTTRERLNEMLKVRHSLAHGFSMPSYSWNRTQSGEVRLTMQLLRWNRSFLGHLVTTTDTGLKAHIYQNYGSGPNW